MALPHRLKLDAGRDKLVLRRAFESSWPASVRARPKQGFGAPVRAWLQRPGFAELVEAYLESPSSRIFDLVDFAGTRDFVARRDYPCWILLALATWLEPPSADAPERTYSAPKPIGAKPRSSVAISSAMVKQSCTSASWISWGLTSAWP